MENNINKKNEVSGGNVRKNIEIQSFKCNGCGNVMSYSGKKDCLHCSYCGNTKTFEKKKCREVPFEERNVNSEISLHKENIYRCSSCGVVIKMEKYENSTLCPYCSAPNIMLEEDLYGIKPNAIVPFKIDKEDVEKVFREYIKKQFFAVGEIKKKTYHPNLMGSYIPSWTFDAYTVSSYSGILGRRVTRTVGSGKNRRTVTTTQYFSVSGVIEHSFEEINIEASHKMTEANMNRIAGFNTNEAYEYSPEFLAGYYTYGYDKDIETAYSEATKGIQEMLKQAIISKHNASCVQSLTINTDYQNKHYKYALLPVYFGDFTFASKKYPFLINGVSGKTYSKYPLSKLKVALTALFSIGFLGLMYLFAKYVTW